MGGIATERQSELSFERLLASGLDVKTIIRILAEDLAYTRNEHKMRAGLGEVKYSINNERLFHKLANKLFEKLIYPDTKTRSPDYKEMPKHVLENLRAAEQLLCSGKVDQVVLLSPAGDFESDNSTKSVIYFFRRVGQEVFVTCSDHSADPLLLQREAKALYGIEINNLLAGNNINGGGVYYTSAKEPPTRQEFVDIFLELSKLDPAHRLLAEQYQKAIYLAEEITGGRNVSLNDYMEIIVAQAEQELYEKLSKSGITLDSDPSKALRFIFREVETELQEIKAETFGTKSEERIRNVIVDSALLKMLELDSDNAARSAPSRESQVRSQVTESPELARSFRELHEVLARNDNWQSPATHPAYVNSTSDKYTPVANPALNAKTQELENKLAHQANLSQQNNLLPVQHYQKYELPTASALNPQNRSTAPAEVASSNNFFLAKASSQDVKQDKYLSPVSNKQAEKQTENQAAEQQVKHKNREALAEQKFIKDFHPQVLVSAGQNHRGNHSGNHPELRAQARFLAETQAAQKFLKDSNKQIPLEVKSPQVLMSASQVRNSEGGVALSFRNSTTEFHSPTIAQRASTSIFTESRVSPTSTNQNERGVVDSSRNNTTASPRSTIAAKASSSATSVRIKRSTPDRAAMRLVLKSNINSLQPSLRQYLINAAQRLSQAILSIFRARLKLQSNHLALQKLQSAKLVSIKSFAAKIFTKLTSLQLRKIIPDLKSLLKRNLETIKERFKARLILIKKHILEFTRSISKNFTRNISLRSLAKKALVILGAVKRKILRLDILEPGRKVAKNLRAALQITLQALKVWFLRKVILRTSLARKSAQSLKNQFSKKQNFLHAQQRSLIVQLSRILSRARTAQKMPEKTLPPRAKKELLNYLVSLVNNLRSQLALTKSSRNLKVKQRNKQYKIRLRRLAEFCFYLKQQEQVSRFILQDLEELLSEIETGDRSGFPKANNTKLKRARLIKVLRDRKSQKLSKRKKAKQDLYSVYKDKEIFLV